MIVGIDNIIEYIKINKCEYFQVKTAPDKDWFTFKSIVEESFEERIFRFRELMKLQTNPGDKLFLEAYEKQGQTKQWFRTWFKLDESTSVQSPNNVISGTPVIQGYSESDV